MPNELEKYIHTKRDDFDQQIPDPDVLNRILVQMQEGEKEKPKGILIPFRVLQWAAASVILIICVIAFRALQKRPEIVPVVKITHSGREQVKNPANYSIAPVSTNTLAQSQAARQKSIEAIDDDLARRRELLAARLKDQDMHGKKKLFLLTGLNNRESPASRITAAAQAYQLKNPDRDVVDALSATLNTDPNANVRLAALDGLARFYQDNYVRKKLITALKWQEDPVVEITLINLLTRMKESGILTELEKIVNDDNTTKAVKDCAYSGIFQLKSS